MKQIELLGIFLFKVSQLGLRGVELFFVLSGFLITGILLDLKIILKYFTTFYTRRFLRILSTLLFCLVCFICHSSQLYTVDPAGVEVINKQTWLWTYTQNISWLWGKGGWDASLNFPSFGHFWSLCVEEHFYLLWPLWIYFTNDKWLPRVMWSIVLISALSVLIVYLFG